MIVRVLGRGKVGRSLHAALRKADVAATLHPARGLLAARDKRALTYLLTVPDAQIAATAQRIAAHVKAGDVVLHCSGNRGPEELAACRRSGASIAVMHPFVSFAHVRSAPNLPQTVWFARGDTLAIRRAKQLARSVTAQCLEGPVGQPAYHAAAAVLANGSAGLADLTVRMLVALGLDRKVACAAASGLLHSVAQNVRTVGVPQALTGPIMRGDADTVRSHLSALAALDPDFARSYADLAPIVLSCAQAAGLTKRDAANIRAVLAQGVSTTTSKGKRPPRSRR